MDFRLLKMFFFFFFFPLPIHRVRGRSQKYRFDARNYDMEIRDMESLFTKKFFSKQRMNFSPISRRDSKKKSLAIFFFLDRCERVIELFFLSFFLSVFLEFWKLPLFSTIYSEENIRRII